MMSFDWDNATWQTGRQAEGPTWRMTVASDWAPMRRYEEQIVANPEGIYGDVLPALRECDLCIVNVESTLGDRGEAIPKGGRDQRAVESLLRVPFHVACLANNHTMDFGPPSLEHTMSVLQQAGLKTVGAGMSGADAARPLVLTVRDVRVAILDCAEGEECRSIGGGPGVYGFEAPAVADQVRSLKSDGQADVVVVVFHGGREHTPLPPPYVVNWLRAVADAGADAVLAHHPHVPQGIELRGTVPIAYSLGNFVFWQNSELFYRRAGYLVHLDFRGAVLARMTLTPYLIRPEGLLKMTGQAKETLLRDLKHNSDLLADPQSVTAAWDAFIDRVGLEGMMNSLDGAIKLSRTEKRPAAAKMLNVFATPAHRELFVRGLRRATRGQDGTSPDWAKELVARWTTLRYDEVVPESA